MGMKNVLVALMLLILNGCDGNAPDKQKASTPQISAVPTSKAPDEEAALDAIAKVNKGQADYFSRNRRYALTYEELIDAFFLDEEPRAAQTGYNIRLRPRADAGSYTIVAIPSTSSPTTRHFFSDQTGDVRAEQGKDANAQSSKISQ